MSDLDHCAEAARLRQILTAVVTGDSVASARFGEEEIRYHKADPARLERLIAYHDGECAKAAGRPARRTRYAMSARHRRY